MIAKTKKQFFGDTYRTPNGGTAWRSRYGNPLEDTPCRQTTNKRKKQDSYYYNFPDGRVKVTTPWESEDVFIG